MQSVNQPLSLMVYVIFVECEMYSRLLLYIYFLLGENSNRCSEKRRPEGVQMKVREVLGVRPPIGFLVDGSKI